MYFVIKARLKKYMSKTGIANFTIYKVAKTGL